MNHVDSVLESDPDDVVLSEVGSDRGEALSNLVGFIGLKVVMRGKASARELERRRREGETHLVSMSSEPILVRVDGNRGHSELMGRPEDSNSDFLDRWEGKERRGQFERWTRVVRIVIREPRACKTKG